MPMVVSGLPRLRVEVPCVYREISGNNRDVIDRDVRNLDTYDHSEWAERGYIYSPQDWKNIEITGYCKIVSKSGSARNWIRYYHIFARDSHNSAVAEGCGGTA